MPDTFVDNYMVALESATECVKCSAETGCDAAATSDLTMCSVCVHNSV